MNLVAKILCYCVSTSGIHITTVILFAVIVEAQDLSDQVCVVDACKICNLFGYVFFPSFSFFLYLFFSFFISF